MRPETHVETVVRILVTAGFVHVDLADLERLAEFDPPRVPAAGMVASTSVHSRPRPKRRVGRVAESTLF